MNSNLLVIEDDVAFASAIARRLNGKGFTCQLAHNTSDALLQCRQVQPEYIVLDMKLELDSGLTLIKPLRSIVPKARIILLTGFASIATAVDAIKLGADDYLSKPVDTKTLVTALLGKSDAGRDTDSVATESHQVLSAERVEWEHIQQVLKANDGNVSATARQLNMHRRTLQRKLQKRPVSQ